MNTLFVFLSCSFLILLPVGSAAPTADASAKFAPNDGQDAWNLNPSFRQFQGPRPNVTALKARITILDVGSIVSKVHGNGKDFEYIPTIALIEDGKDKIIFDTGLPTDIGSFERMIKSLDTL
uniref:MBL fold metallo-hydrolase n=1 Tax=Panagrolaimus sp. ES5 TaxID=591445 RepID=A0AC34GM84_9BILA